MSDIDPLDLLRAANPSPERSTPEPQLSVDALFEQITTNTAPVESAQPDVVSVDSDHTNIGMESLRRSRRWRPTIAMPAAAAVVAAVVGGAVLIQPGNTPSASALVAEAAATSAEFESGRVAVAVDIVEMPDGAPPETFTFDYSFHSGDFALRFESSVADLSGIGDETSGVLDVRGIGDDIFSSFGEPDSFFVSPRSEQTESIEALFGFQPTSMEAATVVALLERTDDFEAVTTDDGPTTYRGSVTVATIEALDPESVPAGLSFLADPNTPNDDLPDTLGVDVVVTVGLLDTLTIEFDGESELGYTKGSITTTFSEYGEPQNIVAPLPGQISDAELGVPGVMPEGFEEALAVLEELESRRPGLCSDIVTDFESSTGVLDDEMIDDFDAFPACLEVAGEQEAADAFRTVTEFGD